MNMDPHWLKEHFKEKTTESLEGELVHLETFDGMSGEVIMLKAELARRETETK
jgi:hypothetical protein